VLGRVEDVDGYHDIARWESAQTLAGLLVAPMNDSHAPRMQRPALRRALKPVLLVAALAIVFGWLLPKFVDYHEVWDALKQLDVGELLVLLALGLARVPTEALMYRAFLPGLSVRRGSAAYLSSNFASQLLPPPSASLVQFGYFRGGGYDSEAAGLAAFGSFLFPMIGRFALPLAALAVVLLAGDVTGTIWLAAALSLAVTGIACVAGYLLLRGDRSARWFGSKLQRPLSWVFVKLKRGPLEDAAEKAADLRVKALAVLREGWALGSIGVAANLAVTYLILLAALRFLDVTATELPAAEAFAAFAIAFWAGAVFPITGSGLGVVDAVMIALLIDLGTASDDALLAALLLWRVFYTVVTLPLGAITLSRFRRTGAGHTLSTAAADGD
jgi:uncharacterized membrane protein YbhN (UPF0104 family)